MTKPVTDLTIRIHGDGTATLTAADWSAEGHLWAIQARPISLAQVRAVAGVLGPDAVSGVEARIAGERERLRGAAARTQAAIERAREAEEALARFDAASGAGA